MLFVLGRQYLLSLVPFVESIQRALFPDVDHAGFKQFRDDLMEEGRRAWDQLVPRSQRESSGGEAPVRGWRVLRSRPPGRALTWDEALDQLSGDDRRPAPIVRDIQKPAPKRLRLAVTGVLAGAMAVFMFAFHPAVAVVSPGITVDIVNDISIAGVATERPSGRYLMTPVNVDRPNIARLLMSWARRRTVVSVVDSRDALEPERLHGRDAFTRSHRDAIVLARKELRLSSPHLSIAVRDRGLSGPSAGLVYALAIFDMLDRADLARGRTIAATGELLPGATIGPVGFVDLKARAARDGGATLFMVPSRQQRIPDEVDMDIVRIDSLRAAIRALEAK